jgi:predicted kinase
VATLIVLSGLPGSGKSSLAKAFAAQNGTLWLRIDSIEQAIRESAAACGPLNDAGYRVAYAVAEENLRLGRDVIGDSVNPWMLTRDAWRDAGLRAGADVLEVELVCSDREEHRRRVEARAGTASVTACCDWQAVVRRDYHPWERAHLRIDSAGRSVGQCLDDLLRALRQTA